MRKRGVKFEQTRQFFLSCGWTGLAVALARGDTRIVEDWRVAALPVGARMPVTAVGPDGTLFLAARDESCVRRRLKTVLGPWRLERQTSSVSR